MAKVFDVVSSSELKERVNKMLAQVAYNKEVVLAGFRLVKNSKTGEKTSIEAEFVQERNLRSVASGGDLMSVLNAGDDRFNRGIKARVWYPITVEGAIKVFGWNPETIEKMYEEAKEINEDQRLAVLTQINTVMADNEEMIPKIVIRETSNINELPESIKNQLGTEYEDRYILSAPIKDSEEREPVVDKYGNTVYRWNILAVSTTEDQLVPDKKPLSRFVQDGGATNGAKALTAESNLANMLTK